MSTVNGQSRKFHLLVAILTLVCVLLLFQLYADPDFASTYVKPPLDVVSDFLNRILNESVSSNATVVTYTDVQFTNLTNISADNYTLSVALVNANTALRPTVFSTISDRKVQTSSVPSLAAPTNYITCYWKYGHGLGNYMFPYAVMWGLADLLKLEPVIKTDDKHVYLDDVFDLNIRRLNDSSVQWLDIGEECVTCYTPDRYTSLAKNRSIRLSGYLQSSDYFSNIRSVIVDQFRFKNATMAKALEAKTRITDVYCNNVSSCLLIGVHIRRGDYTYPGKFEYGYLVADEQYLQRSVNFYAENFANYTRVFVVLGNDFDWNSKTFSRFLNETSVVVKPITPEIDMCILSLCDHSIMTAGTFGFWSAYLAGGNVTYMRNFTRPGSDLERVMRDPMCPRHWVGL